MKRFMAILLLLMMVLCGCGTSTSKTSEEGVASTGGEEGATQSTQQDTTTGIGATVDLNDFKITLDQAEYYDSEDGNQYVLLWYTVENGRAESKEISMSNEMSFYNSGIDIYSEGEISGVNGDVLWGSFAPGEKRSGYAAYLLPEGWTEIECNYPLDFRIDDYGYMHWDTKATFTLKSEDVK